ncbi:MAG: efflux RND transporter periplasmic adaptor subunit [Candidatus Eisenbacteria bacterium]|uniref:Efflux RND transporter periplasmic adaptor subunit n=1 Tax=Eiseniibacteriota bacterium TaxID=2212470 RepID=A0A538SIN4_UNCEI|nr:MAG: efflux RND transporter periplasmic adaptor subunit [Candidatus Eisenbacteria bacterium]
MHVKVHPKILRTLVVLMVASGAIAGVVLVRRARDRSTFVPVMTEAVQRRDIALTIEATGTVEPIDLVEVKSKASGQIIRMPVEVGTLVKANDLLAQIDTRDVKNQYDQALAALRAAEAKANISGAQQKRSDDLFTQGAITADEHEAAVLDYANAQAQLVGARTNLDLAKQRLDDATVRAPIAGTVLEQLVSAGQVISSATTSASGGTSLLKMADLSRIRLRALVSETDVGNVHPGQTASVTVDAFPQRTFTGQVEKIEPEAVVQQSVTMFPVLISISNEERVLLPGMNGEVAMLVDRHDGVPAVPLDAVRSVRELPVAAAALGLDPDSVRMQVERQIQARAAERASRLGAGGGSGAVADRGGGRNWMADAAFASDSARARWPGRGRLHGGRGSWGGAGRGAAGANGAGNAGAPDPAAAGGARAFARGGSQGFDQGSGIGRASRAQVVFVKTAHGLEPRVVRLGLSDFDYSEVLNGLSEGEQVALLGVAEAQAQRKQDQSRFRQRVGSGVPGVPSGGGGGGRGAGGRGGG